MSKALLTKAEHDLLDRLGKVSNDFVKIVGKESSRAGDIEQAVFLINNLQNMILAQAASRAYPKKYRLLGQVTFKK